MTQFCLDDRPPYPCLGLSLSDDLGDVEFIHLQTKGRNGILRPLLYNHTYVGVNKEDYLVLKSHKGSPVLFVNEPRFRSVDGKCVTPMKCNRNKEGFCSRTSNERATHLARGAVIKLLPCLETSPEWTVIRTRAPTGEYEQPQETKTPTSPSLSPDLFLPSPPSTSPSFVESFSPTLSPSYSPHVSSSSPTLLTVVPTTSPVSLLLVTPSPTSVENQTTTSTVAFVIGNSYFGLFAIVIVLAICFSCRSLFFKKIRK